MTVHLADTILLNTGKKSYRRMVRYGQGMEISQLLAISLFKVSVSITLATRGMSLERTYTAALSNYSY